MKRNTIRNVVIAGIGVVVAAGVYVAVQNQKKKTNADFFNEVRTIREQGGGSQSTGGLLASEGAERVEASIEVETTEFDMGVVSNTEPTTKSMTIKNVGKRPLLIYEVTTTCTCTVGHFDVPLQTVDGQEVVVIEPGKEVPMQVSLNPFMVRGFDSTKTLTIKSNDPDHVFTDVNVHATIQPEFEMSALEFDFGSVTSGTSAEKTIVIKQTEPVHYSMFSVERSLDAIDPAHPDQSTASPDNPNFEVTLTERPQSEWSNPELKEWEVTVTLSPNIKPGPYAGEVALATDAPRYEKPMMRLTVRAMVGSYFSVTPPTVTVRNAVAPGTEIADTITVTAADPIDVTNLAVSNSALTVTKENVSPSEVQIHVGVAADAPPGMQSASITFDVMSGDRRGQQVVQAYVAVADKS